MNHLACLQ